MFVTTSSYGETHLTKIDGMTLRVVADAVPCGLCILDQFGCFQKKMFGGWGGVYQRPDTSYADKTC